MTRQRAWQLRMVQEGRCMICGQPRELHAWRCVKHAQAHRLDNRRRRGGQPWRPGRGRPPLESYA